MMNQSVTALINSALQLRGLLPMDGHCECAKCHRSGLNRDQLAVVPSNSRIAPLVDRCGGPVCHQCEEVLWLDLEDTKRIPPQDQVGRCSECGGTGGGDTRFDYARGQNVTEWCIKCNGDG